MSSLVTRQKIQEYIRNVDNKKTWTVPREKFVGASETFQCQLRTALNKRGYTRDPEALLEEDQEGFATRGNFVEKVFANAVLLETFGHKRTLIDQTTWLEGVTGATPDAIITECSDDILFAQFGVASMGTSDLLYEIKSIDPRAYGKVSTAEKIEHSFQAQMQMGVLHAKSNYRPEYVIIWYINSSNYADSVFYLVKRDPEIYTAGKSRNVETMDPTIDVSTFPTEGMFDGQCKTCDFRTACASVVTHKPEGDRSQKFVMTGPAADELETAALSYIDVVDKLKGLEAKKKSLRSTLGDLLHAAGSNVLDTGKIKTSLTYVNGRRALDAGLVREYVDETGGDINALYSEGGTSARITVKKHKEKTK